MSEGPGPLGPLGPVVATDRLRLILITPADAADMLAGRRQSRWHPDYPRQDDVDGASMVREASPWGSRHVVHEQLAVGSIGFFGPPDDQDPDGGEPPEVEVGFGLVADLRGRGLVTEALRALLADTDRLGVRVRASVEPTNAASLRVLAKTGFTELRGADAEGHLVMARPLPTSR